MPETSSNSRNGITAVDPTDHLPLRLFRSEIIPPAPTRAASCIDWLPDFAGYSWVTYGASSLLVISHFPSPLSQDETLIGPIFRQVFELSDAANAVSWSKVVPSIGELAAASENCICLFSHDSANSKGSFCWSQNAVLVHSAKVEAIEWTGSGDGIIAGGIEVTLWTRRSRSWEIAWKFKGEQPQNLVSSTWSIEGPAATATFWNELHAEGSNEMSKCVSVCYSDRTSAYAKAELHHPQPISMIQWRPQIDRQSVRDLKYSTRHILLTCCFDGAVRLWSEIDNGKGRKVGKESDHRTIKRSFCVAAVIEINQALNGTLGTDVFLTWAMQIGGILKTGGDANKFFSIDGYKHDRAGRCEWLVAFGPGLLVTFWAIHCLDDTSPMRFPRVTLWKRQELLGFGVGHLHSTGLTNSRDLLHLNKTFILRNSLSGSPTICSLIHLLPCNSFIWSLLYTKISSNMEDASVHESHTESSSLCLASGKLDMDGHTGKILHVALHPYICEVELAASLDSNGLLLLWSLSTPSNCILDLPTLNPSWRLCGRLVQDPFSKYTSMSWAPSVLAEERVLLLGHVGGVDCFIMKFYQNDKDDIVCHYLCTMPFTGHTTSKGGPTNIFSIPLPSSCIKTFKHNKFMLLGVWMNGFQALSWEITLHSCDSITSCSGCNFFDNNNSLECSRSTLEGTLAGKKYYVSVFPSSSEFPEPHKHDQVTSFAVVCPSCSAFENDAYSNLSYTMATGQADGTLKLWRSRSHESSTSLILWELVGMFSAHQGPVSAICLNDSGQKIATLCKESHASAVSSLCIWDTVDLTGTGAFLLEDTLSLDGVVVAFKWLALGCDQLLLGVCMKNELRVYAQRRCGGQNLINSNKSLKMEIWLCIASTCTFSTIHDCLWGPRGTAVVIHDSYFSLYSQWLFLVAKKHHTECYTDYIKNNSFVYEGEADEDMSSAIFTDSGIVDLKESTVNEDNRRDMSMPAMKTYFENGKQSGSLFVASTQLKRGSTTMLDSWGMLDVAEKLRGSLPIYHPEALLMNIYSGNWKRAYVSLRHLVEHLTSSDALKKRYPNAKSSHSIPQIILSNYFEGHLSNKANVEGLQWNGASDLLTPSSQFQRSFNQSALSWESCASSNMPSSASTKSELSGFFEPLDKLYELAALTSMDKIQILAIIDLINEVSDPHSASAYRNLDEPGRRFWVALRFQQLYFFRRFGRSASVEELVVDSHSIGCAFHSDCQETLFGSFLSNEPSWQEMRTLGVGFWFTNATQLRSRMEKLARLQYLKNKDPKDCALLYIALNRIQVLAGLFKISKNEKDKPLVGFLSRNFQEEKNKAAALKNAYVLMGRHQLEMAIAFFLLGGDASSAVTVCAKNIGDEQLALVICQLVEGRGGPLERHLITKFILPSAIERGDYWLVSLLEWELGNYSQSFFAMVGFHQSFMPKRSTLSSKHVAFMDPSIGLFCLTLANKNNMKNAIGEQNAASLGRWAILMTAIALNRCGLPLEALEGLSSSISSVGVAEPRDASNNGHFGILYDILNPSGNDSSNWLLGNVASILDIHVRFDLALQYFSKLIREHLNWPDTIVENDGATAYSKAFEIHHYEKLLDNFKQRVYVALAQFEQKFSLASSCLISRISGSLCRYGLFCVGCDILRGYTPSHHSADEQNTVDKSLLHSVLHKRLLKSTEDICLLFSRFIAACSITCMQLKVCYIEDNMSSELKSNGLEHMEYYFQGLILLLWSSTSAMRGFFSSFDEDAIKNAVIVLDLFEYVMYFASAWLKRDTRGLFRMIQPLLITFSRGHTPYEVDMVNLKTVLHQNMELAVQNTSVEDVGGTLEVDEHVHDKHAGDLVHSVSEDERWQILGICLWQHMSKFINFKLNSLSIEFDGGHLSGISHDKLSSQASSCRNFESNNSITEQSRLLSLILAKLLDATLAHISSHNMKQLALSIEQKVHCGSHVPTLLWLEESRLSQARDLYVNHSVVSADMMNDKDDHSVSKILWDSCVDPSLIAEGFVQENVDWPCLNYRPCKGWSDMYNDIIGERETVEPYNHDGRPCNGSGSGEVGSPTRGLFRNGLTFLSSWQKDTNISKEVTPFQSSKEIYKRNGELLEALCINSIDQRQAAVASNQKGIIFFNWEAGIPYRDQSDYIWSDADWPQNGWAGSESTPVPTCVSPGVGLGSRKGAHLGLGGATVGVGSLAGPGRDLTGGGAFGIPGYAGIGASGLGWEIQEDFEEFVDPPATAETISTRAFSSHPSRPFFLVGSSNTHIYLWEFGKHKATATYGVLPAANVPPPYALASISSLQFDHYGHRFATAALDGTVCTWQLEVGGRSNIRPTDSSLCFNSHASDVTYITSSGSVIATAGYSSNGVNVVMWDTLAPPTTSRASIICHEGGARSISVFDNDIGSGSISPLIVTGGKGGDVGLHDFRYIATGRTKRQRHLDNGEPSISSSSTDMRTGISNKHGDQNLNGMLWYIPKAHLGSVTKISTIPNTSLFLTGSKDGDVKLWDAKAAKLVYHWSKLHERHTFLQPSSRGYGGIVRAAVTDIQVCSNGFLTCGGDGSVKLVQIRDYQYDKRS